MSGWLAPWRTGHSLASWVSDMIGPVHINLTVTIAPDSVALLAQLLKLVQPSAAPRAAAAPPPLPPAAATHIIDRPKLVWTPERLAVLRDMYPRGVPIDEMMAAANALPGPPVKRNQVSIKAAGIGLRRLPLCLLSELFQNKFILIDLKFISNIAIRFAYDGDIISAENCIN